MLKRVTISKVPVVQKDSNFIMFFTQSIFKLLLVQILHGVYINRKKKTLKQIINGLKTRIINCKYLFGYEGRFCFTYPDYFHSGFLLFFLKNPALLGVFDVHHKHSKACEGRRNNPLEYTEAKLKTFRFSSYFHSGKQKSRNEHRLEETTSKQTNESQLWHFCFSIKTLSLRVEDIESYS